MNKKKVITYVRAIDTKMKQVLFGKQAPLEGKLHQLKLGASIAAKLLKK